METNIHMIYDYHKILFTLLDRNYVFVNWNEAKNIFMDPVLCFIGCLLQTDVFDKAWNWISFELMIDYRLSLWFNQYWKMCY